MFTRWQSAKLYHFGGMPEENLAQECILENSSRIVQFLPSGKREIA
jgi:hypothetical protein